MLVCIGVYRVFEGVWVFCDGCCWLMSVNTLHLLTQGCDSSSVGRVLPEDWLYQSLLCCAGKSICASGNEVVLPPSFVLSCYLELNTFCALQGTVTQCACLQKTQRPLLKASSFCGSLLVGFCIPSRQEMQGGKYYYCHDGMPDFKTLCTMISYSTQGKTAFSPNGA